MKHIWTWLACVAMTAVGCASDDGPPVVVPGNSESPDTGSDGGWFDVVDESDGPVEDTGTCGDDCDDVGADVEEPCADGGLRCGGACVDTTTNMAHCGGCDALCSPDHGAASCESGTCALTCDQDYDDCNDDPSDGCEADLSANDSCGACGLTCAGNETCRQAVCQCDDAFVIESVTPGPNLPSASASEIVLNLSCRPDPTTANLTTVAVHGGQSGPISGSITSTDQRQLTFTPSRAFQPGERVSVTVTGELRNIAGVGIAPRVWSFRAATEGGSGEFENTGQTLGDESCSSVSLADFDDDGDLDALTADRHAPAQVLRNDGVGFFGSVGSVQAFEGIVTELADMDGDGDLDLVGAGEHNVGWWANLGEGNFDTDGQLVTNDTARWIGTGDFDADGKLDVLVIQATEHAVWLNDGHGNLAIHANDLQLGGEHADLGDLDGDGDLDAFVAARNEANMVWLNDGSGTLTDSGQTLGDADSVGVELGDVDGDGDLDALVANYGLQVDRLWLNDGHGTFEDGNLLLGAGLDSICVALGDLDGDGDLDAFVGHGENAARANVILLNNGAGAFADSGQRLGNWHTYGVALGDLDGDGDLDLYVGNWGRQGERPNTVWRNTNP